MERMFWYFKNICITSRQFFIEQTRIINRFFSGLSNHIFQVHIVEHGRITASYHHSNDKLFLIIVRPQSKKRWPLRIHRPPNWTIFIVDQLLILLENQMYKTNCKTFEQFEMQLAKVRRGTDKNNFIIFKYDPNWLNVIVFVRRRCVNVWCCLKVKLGQVGTWSGSCYTYCVFKFVHCCCRMLRIYITTF